MKKWFAAVLLAALVLTGCGPKQPEAHEAQLFAMDTLMSLRIWGDEALVTQTEDTLRSKPCFPPRQRTAISHA